MGIPSSSFGMLCVGDLTMKFQAFRVYGLGFRV